MSVDIFSLGDRALYLLRCSRFHQFSECPPSGHTSNECRQAKVQLPLPSLFKKRNLAPVFVGSSRDRIDSSEIYLK